MTHFFKVTCVCLLLSMISGCAITKGDTPEEKRQSIFAMKNDVLSQLYKVKPQAKEQIKKAPGYAVFSNANLYAFFVSFGGGYGVVKDNTTGKYTYMNMGEAGVGFGLGAKDFRIVFVFHNKETMHKFIEEGWQFGGQADAAAKASDKGDAVGGEISLSDVTIYQLTETGLALQITVKGTKYWKDEELN